jgi:hypothetical protein
LSAFISGHAGPGGGISPQVIGRFNQMDLNIAVPQRFGGGHAGNPSPQNQDTVGTVCHMCLQDMCDGSFFLRMFYHIPGGKKKSNIRRRCFG